jgi:hypothetical protein
MGAELGWSRSAVRTPPTKRYRHQSNANEYGGRANRRDSQLQPWKRSSRFGASEVPFSPRARSRLLPPGAGPDQAKAVSPILPAPCATPDCRLEPRGSAFGEPHRPRPQIVLDNGDLDQSLTLERAQIARRCRLLKAGALGQCTQVSSATAAVCVIRPSCVAVGQTLSI